MLVFRKREKEKKGERDGEKLYKEQSNPISFLEG